MISHPLTTSAELRLGDNGPDAKTAPVSIVAYTGKPVWFDELGDVIFDLVSYQPAKSKIPLDHNHDSWGSCGYLNRFDVVDGELIVKGAMVPFGVDDYTAKVINDIREGVPYQASIETHDFILEFVPEGIAITVNKQTVEGPIFVVRNWTLGAVAICKWGKDSDTSVSLAASLRDGISKNMTAKKVFLRAIGNEKDMDKKNQTPTVVEASATAEVETVEKQDKTEVEVETKVVEAVEASKSEVTDVTKEIQTEQVAASEPRSEFKMFCEAFGNAQAAEYFAAGLSFADATAKFVVALREENDSLKQRLAAANQGETKPIKFNDTHSEQKPQGSFIRLRK